MWRSSKSFGSLSGLEVPMMSRELSQRISSTSILILPRGFFTFSMACLRIVLGGILIWRPETRACFTCMGLTKSPAIPE